jgi:hypothetical protein
LSIAQHPPPLNQTNFNNLSVKIRLLNWISDALACVKNLQHSYCIFLTICLAKWNQTYNLQ